MRHRLGSTARWAAASLMTILAGTDTARAAARIEQVVRGDGLLVAIRDGQILRFAPDGTRLGRCGRAPAPPGRAQRPRLGAADPAEILHDAGFPEDDSTPEAEEVIDDERGFEPKPRPRGAVDGEGPVGRALAASGAAVWAATSDGVWLVQAGGCLRVALPGRDLVAIAAGAGVVVAASASQLFRADGVDPSRPDSWAFRTVAGLSGPPRALTIGGERDTPIAGDGSPEEAAVAAALSSCCDQRPVRPRARIPDWVWPTVTATLTIDRTLTRRTVTGFLLLRFPFDRAPRGTAEQSALALEWARRDADRIRAQLAAGAGPDGATP